MTYNQILGIVLLAAAATIPLRAHAARVDVDINIGPPPVIAEPIPAGRDGYTWAPGYWDYDNNRHVWREGHWERNRHGERWTDGRWHEHEGHWTLERGHWDRD